MTNRSLAEAACKMNPGKETKEEDGEILMQQATTFGFGRRMSLSPRKLGTELHLGLVNGPGTPFHLVGGDLDVAHSKGKDARLSLAPHSVTVKLSEAEHS